MSKYLSLPFISPCYKAVFAVYMKIAEPRVKRLIYFVIYILLGALGVTSAMKPNPEVLHYLGGNAPILVYCAFIVAGAGICAFSVLPGIWVLERAGMFGSGVGIVLYVAARILQGASPSLIIFPIIIILMFLLRWLDIKDYLLAPRKE